MGKLSNIRQNLTSLARKPTPDIGAEVGTSTVGLMPSIFDEEFIDTSKVKVEDYKKMLDSDGTIQALYNTIVMPLLGCNWTIEPDNQDSSQAVEQSVWVEKMLRKPPHKGGMSTPFDLFLAQALRAVLEGFAGFEKVYMVSEGKIVYKKIAWRDPSTVTMRTDDRGGFNGLRQRAFVGNTYDIIDIPLERCFLYTFGKEFHNLKGRSAFSAAYVAYDKKRRLLYLLEQQAQSDALLTKVVRKTADAKGGQDELDETVASVDEIGFKATVGLPVGYEVDVLNTSGRMEILSAIEFQNAEMARSVLAMFMLLGNSGNTGSFALSKDLSDFFVQSLMAVRKSLENHITAYLLPDLYDFNYAIPEYGTFKFEDITDSTVDLLKTAFIKIIEKDRLSDSVVEGIVQKMADKLDIDVDMIEESLQEGQNGPTVEPQNDTVTPDPDSEYDTGNTRNMSLSRWRRELTPAETKVSFEGLQKKLDSLESQTIANIKPIWEQIVSDATMKINRYVENGEYDKITVKTVFDENLRNQYTKVLKEAGLEAYLYGKNGASDELEKKAPGTPKASKDFFGDNAKQVTEKQFSDLIFKIQSEITKGRRKDQLSRTSLSVGEIIASIAELFGIFYEDTIGLTAITTVAIGVNLGRKDVFDFYKDDIYGYQYSALLDAKTCPTCLSLDGKVLDEASYKRTSYDPPIHFSCRCLTQDHTVDVEGFGEKNIADVAIGDYVRTHENRYRKVLGKSERLADDIFEIIAANGAIIRCTSNHPLFTQRGWVEAKDLLTSDVLHSLPKDGSYDK